MTTFVKLSSIIMSNQTTTSKTNDDKHKCTAAVKCNTHLKSVEKVLEGIECILYNDNVYYLCQKNASDGEDLCSRHKGAKSLLIYEDIKKEGEILTKEHSYIQKHLPKYLNKQGKKSILPTTSISDSNISFVIDISSLELTNEEKNTLTTQIKESANNFISSFKEQKLSLPDISSISDEQSIESPQPEISLDSDTEEKDEDCKSVVEKLIDESDKMDNSDSDDEVPCKESESESDESDNELFVESDKLSFEEESIEIIEIESKKGNSYGLDENNNSVYDVESGDELGKLIKVIDTNSSISYEDEDYCIGEKIEIDDTTYIKCILTERLYDFDSKKLIGVLGKKKDGSLKIRKSKK